MSNEPDVKPGAGPSFSLIAWLLLIGAILLVIALLIPAVEQAREAARRSQSKNNLKQLGLAFHNYHDTNNTLPPGGIFNVSGVPYHGWSTSLAPYFDASPWYNSLNMNVPWDDPTQLDLFINRVQPVLQNPRVNSSQFINGVSRDYYAGNAWLLHRNSSITFAEIGSLEQTLLAGESVGNFPPTGFPGNWRDVRDGLNTKPDSFGMVGKEPQILLADGQVRGISPQIDKQVWDRLAGPEGLKPPSEEMRRPVVPTDLSTRPRQRGTAISDEKTRAANQRRESQD